MTATKTFRAQSGPQWNFLESSADIVIFGGAAGGGKTWGLLADDLYHIDNPRYTSITFRRTFPQIRNPGGLWDESRHIYPHVGGEPNESKLEWHFPSGALVKFAHMQYESDKHQYQGAQINVIKFDEVNHFSEAMFFYMLSRNRSVSGIPPYVRATCNADADSWVAAFIAWWIDQESGFPIPERAGVIRWFVRDGGAIRWASDPQDLPWVEVEIDGEMVPQPPKSVTFIPAKVTDNKELLRENPQYLVNLLSLPMVDRMRLLEGNWKIRAASGNLLKREWFKIIDAVPHDIMSDVRFWDMASTEKSGGNDPDATAGVHMGRTSDNRIVILDVRTTHSTPKGVKSLIKQTAQIDGYETSIRIEQEPGSSGKTVIDDYVSDTLFGWDVDGKRSTGKKVTRAMPYSAQVEAGNVYLLRAPWNAAYLDECDIFPDGPHDDQVDASSGAFEYLSQAGDPITPMAGPARPQFVIR